MLKTTSTTFGSTLSLTSDIPSNDYPNHNLISIEKIILYISTIGPILMVLFFAFIIPEAIEFISVSNSPQIHLQQIY